MRTVTVFLVILAAGFAAGCGGGDGEEEGSGGGGAPARSTIQVSGTDFEFHPSNISAEPGEVTIELTNDGKSPHAIEVEGNGVEEESETIDPGEKTTLTVDLEEGEYEVYCPVGNHKDLGMEGTLTAGGGGAGAGETTTGDDEIETTETTETDGEDDAGVGY